MIELYKLLVVCPEYHKSQPVTLPVWDTLGPCLRFYARFVVEGGGSKPGRQIEWLETYFDIHLDKPRKSDLVSAAQFEDEMPYNLISDPDISEQGGHSRCWYLKIRYRGDGIQFHNFDQAYGRASPQQRKVLLTLNELSQADPLIFCTRAETQI